MGRQLVPSQTRLGFRFPRGVKVNVGICNALSESLLTYFKAARGVAQILAVYY